MSTDRALYRNDGELDSYISRHNFSTEYPEDSLSAENRAMRCSQMVEATDSPRSSSLPTARPHTMGQANHTSPNALRPPIPQRSCTSLEETSPHAVVPETCAPSQLPAGFYTPRGQGCALLGQALAPVPGSANDRRGAGAAAFSTFPVGSHSAEKYGAARSALGALSARSRPPSAV